MKASELMIGDWVLVAECVADAHFRHYPDKVESISKDLVGLASDGLETILDRINPIPLTEEILVKNGFVCTQDKQWPEVLYWELTTDEEYFAIEENRLTDHVFYNYAGIYIESLHQLQHLLRLCGIEKTIEL